MLSLKKVAWLLLLPFVVACEKDLEYDVASPKPTLVVNCIFAQDSLWQVEVSTTADPGNGGQIQILKDAQVAIFENNVRITDIVLDSIDAHSTFLSGGEIERSTAVKLYFHRTVTSTAHAGRNYEIRVSHPDYPTVYSASVIPRAARVRVANYSATGYSQIVSGAPQSRIAFSITDDGGHNYYGIEVWARKNESDPFLHRIPFYSEDRKFQENTLSSAEEASTVRFYSSNSTVFFSNNGFSGLSRDFGLFISSSYYNDAKDIFVRILRLSPELYEFAITYQKQLVNQANPFAEPAQVFSNIQNGAGIFAGYSISDFEVK